MTERERLPNLRESMTVEFIHREGIDKIEQHYRATFGFADSIRAGGIAEVFLNSVWTDSQADTLASEAAMLASQLIQRGVALADVATMLKRNADGSPGSPLGTALEIAERERLALLARLDDAPHVDRLARRDEITREIAAIAAHAFGGAP